MSGLVRHIGRWFAGLLILLLLIIGLLAYLTLTQSGLQFIGNTLQSQLGESLNIGEIQGSLLTTIDVTDVRVVAEGNTYQLAHARLDWSPLALLAGTLQLNSLTADSVDIQLTGDEADSDTPFSIDVELPLDITLSKAELTSISITGLAEAPVIINDVSLSANAADDQLTVASLMIAAEDYAVTLAGVLGLRPDTHSELMFDWSLATDDVTTKGEAQVNGLLSGYTLQGQTSLSGEQLPPGQWQFIANGNLESLTLSSLQGDTLQGQVSGNAQLGWETGFDWRATLSLSQLNPSTYWPEWPGELNAELLTTGHLSDENQQGSLQLNQLQGSLRGYPLTGQLDVALDNSRLTINAFDLQTGDNRMVASGTINQQWDVNAQLTVVDLAATVPDWSGAFVLDADLKGARDQPDIALDLENARLSGPGLSIDQLTAEARLHWSESGKQSVTAKATSLTIADQAFEQAELRLSGLIHQHQLSLVAEGEESAVDLQLAGDWRDSTWRGEVRRFDWAYPGAGRWALRQAVSIELAATQIKLPELCWDQQVAYLCLQAEGNPADQFASSAQLKEFPLETLGGFKQLPAKLTSKVDADLQATLSAGQLSEASVQVNLGAGSVVYQDPTLPPDSRIQGGVIDAHLNTAGLTASADLNLSDNDFLRAQLVLAGYQPGITPWDQQTLDLAVKGELKNMLVLKTLLDEVGSFQGTLLVDIQGSGTLGQPRLSGGASVSDSTLEIDPIGISLTNLDIQLASKDDGLLVTGRCDSGDGSLTVTGDITITDIAHWQADVTLQGNNFEVMHLPEAIITVSPDIQAQLTPPEIRLTGEVHVPYARLRPRDIKSRAGISADVVIVDETVPAEADERWQVSSDIRLSLGDDVDIDGYGLKGDILGSIRLHDTPGQATTARGSLSIERGSYKAYGRELDINRGQLLFSGGAVDNPGLDFEASREVDDITAGIRAHGTLKNPEITLYSDPDMTDSDIISYIAFGRPQSSVGQGGGSATDAGLLAGGDYLAGMLGSEIGLEELGIESGETLEDSAMVLGTYLSPQLYVRYRTGLYDAINEFEVRYEFTRRWSVRTVTSVEASSAEVQFSFER